MERGIATQRPQRQTRVLVDVTFADFDKPPKLSQTRQPHRDRFRRQRVQHHIDTPSRCQIHHRLGKVSLSGIDHILDTQGLQQSTLRRTAGRSDHISTQMMRNLNRRHAHTTRARMHQDHLSRFHPRHRLECVPCRHEHNRKRRRLLKCQVTRNRPHVCRTR